jgi:hypothetical protein
MTDDIEICIVQRLSDGTFAYAEGRGGEVIELGNTLPGAVNALDALGIAATHWLPGSEHAIPLVIPSGIVRRHLGEDQKAALPRG